MTPATTPVVPPPIPPSPVTPSPPTTVLSQATFVPPAFVSLPTSIMGSVDIADAFLNPANDLPMLLTGAQAFMARDFGAVPVEIAEDPRVTGIVACQDPEVPGCSITRQQ